ncbi:MAG: N-acetyltransferase [Kiritimatiellia bacterium]|nr:N-acetyltransferase [Kiritimatiellia bacterium]
MENLVIRLERPEEERAVEELVRDAFWNVYRPGALEHFVLHRLRSHPAFVRELDAVMLLGGELVGQIVFVRAEVALDGGRRLPVLAMGPICVTPRLQRRGLGKRLLDHALERAAALGFGAACFEGNSAFYGKSGFRPASDFGIRYHGLEPGADASFFLAKPLREGYLDGLSGEYAPPAPYFVCDREPEAFAAYDATFEPREKRRLPGQLF